MFNRSFELDKLCTAESFDDGEICICLLEVLTLGTFKKRENSLSWEKNDKQISSGSPDRDYVTKQCTLSTGVKALDDGSDLD